MTRCRPILFYVGLCVALLCSREVRAEDAQEGVRGDVATEIAVLQAEVATLEQRLLPPVLLDRAGIEAVFGSESTELNDARWGRDGLESVTRYPLQAGASLDVWYADGHAAQIALRSVGEASGRTLPRPPDELREEWSRRKALCVALLDAYRDRLPAAGWALPENTRRTLVVHLADHPESRLCGAIIVSLPAESDAELLPHLFRFPGEDQRLQLQRRLRALAERRPELLGDLIAALADDAVDEARRVTVAEVLQVVAGYGGRELDAPWYPRARRGERRARDDDVRAARVKWWREWWDRHRNHTRLDRLREPLAIERYRWAACVAVGYVEDPRAIPILAGLLDDGSRAVRLRAASALLRRKYAGRRYADLAHPAHERDEAAVIAEAREWVRGRGPAEGAPTPPAAPAEPDKSDR